MANIFTDLCGCGKPARYFSVNGESSCNKYMRCPTYETLEELAKQRANLIMQALTLIQLSETFDINLGKGWRKFKDDAKAIGLEVKKNS